MELSRLTVRQYETTIADLVGSFGAGAADPGTERGLKGQYYNSRNFQGNKRVLERVDRQIKFKFCLQNPDELLTSNEFAMRWSGSVIAP